MHNEEKCIDCRCFWCRKEYIGKCDCRADGCESNKGDAVTQEITTYKNDSLDFNIVDTRGFEFNVWNQNKIMKSLSKLIKKG